ncbi:hypothetical protein [Pedobacter ginsengisoli]|uniref:hypothetical protein n=1 Tax=Pedobacter ginsengisoli TaxID=363852 RepID=UPI0012FDDE52|nr:hypothetical protein [Pedobacter ginsengisoli]
MSFTPCKDVHASKEGADPVISVEAHSNNEHSGVKDSCSPFCACACCSSPTVVKHQLVQHTISIILEKKYTDLYSGSVASASIAVWQPPKLVS